MTKSNFQVPSFVTMTKEILKRLWPDAQTPSAIGLRLRLLLSLSLSIVTIFLILWVPLAFKGVLESLQQPTLLTTAVFAAGVYALVHFMHKMTWTLQEIIITPLVYWMAESLQYDLFSHLHKLSLNFHLTNRAGIINTMLSRINYSLHNFVMMLIFYFSALALEILGVTFILWKSYGNHYLGLLLLGGVLYASLTFRLGRHYNKAQDLANSSDNEVGGKGLDSLVNFSSVHAFNNQDHEKQIYRQYLKLRTRLNVAKAVIMLRLHLWHEGTVSAALGLITILSVWEFYQGKLGVADVVTINIYLLQIGNPLAWLGLVMSEVAESGNNLRQVLGLFSVKPEIINKPEAKILKISEGRVQFNEVSFGYKKQRPILNRVSFIIEPGQKVALVGATGAGKSTISNLLLRFFEPQEGQILIDGQDIAQVTLASLRAVIGLVPQDTSLFNDTIRFNIHYGNIQADASALEEAAKLADIQKLIQSLPQGYETIVGERGLQLSGGEKQRIAIARCLLKRPPIFIFDEATSALDSETERAIQKNLNQLAEGATTLVIAHRLATIMDADQILVLDRGHIIERGTHEELIALKGHYARLWRKQTTGEIVGSTVSSYMAVN